jgi:NAD(P)-dependent dehydrogenase (short-subunit alcohol dehydrogenase family)
MPRTVLLTEGDSPLGGALARLLAARGFTVIATRDRSGPEMQAGAGVHAVPWNRRSPVSARTVLLDALNLAGARDKSGGLDEAIILEPPSPGSARLEEASSADIERSFDDAKGPIFIAREILAHFTRRGSGVLSFVLVGLGVGPLESGLRESLRGAAAALLASPPLPTILVNGFQASSADIEEYAQFIDRTMEERARRISGRWFTCQSRGGFLRRMP